MPPQKVEAGVHLQLRGYVLESGVCAVQKHSRTHKVDVRPQRRRGVLEVYLTKIVTDLRPGMVGTGCF